MRNPVATGAKSVLLFRPAGLLRLAGIALASFGLSGCLQLETCIRLHEDGSATISERVRFSRQLLDLAGDRKEGLLKLLDKEAVLERVNRMGKGIRLVHHELRDAEGGSKESVSCPGTNQSQPKR